MDIEHQFSQLHLGAIHQYVESKAEESLYLDFKTITRADLGSADDRRNLAIAISGFANSSGGLIVWGVDARKLDPDGPDVASALKEIDDVSLFVSRINDLTGTSVSPIVDGVQTRGIESRDGRGFAVTLVPESDGGPHMALNREGRYHKRSGSSFYKMEHFDLEDMFGRRRRPRLQLELSMVKRGFSRSSSRLEYPHSIVVSLRNEGRGSAQNVFVRLSVNAPFFISSSGPEADGRGGLSRSATVSEREQILRAEPRDVVHPGMRQGIVAIAVAFDEHAAALPDLKVRVDLAADGVPLHQLEATLSGGAVLSALREP